ncbi:MAG: DUF2270 domain-containing protein [Thermoanaerobaculia bacterium]
MTAASGDAADTSSAESQDPAFPTPAAHSKLSGAEFTTAMAHLYRGEVSRSNTWRSRLDATTNWAVITTAAALTFAFGHAENTPVVLLIVTQLVLLFLFIEARRYRYYELWTNRVRLLETNFFSPVLSSTCQVGSDWRQRLTDSLRRPAFPISLLEAVGRRYRRTYALLFLVLAVSWLVKILIHPSAVGSWSEFLERAAVGPIPGWAAVTVGVLFNIGLLALGFFTVGLRESDAEVFGESPGTYLRLLARLRAATREALEVDLASFKPEWRGSRKRLVFIISDEIEAISDPLLKELDRGITLIKGVGMYSGEEHGILMCVVSGGQAERLREIVNREDENAFVVVTAAQDVRGEGFRPLEA